MAWTKSLSDYPATTYALKYALQAVGLPLITIAAAASGVTHAVNVTAAVSAVYAPAVYLWTSYAESGSGAGLLRYPVARGQTLILPSPLAGLGSTHSSRMLTLIEAALEGRIPRGLESTNIDGQEISRIPIPELHELRTKYQREVFTERDAARAAAGLSVPRSIGIAFRRP